MQAQNGRSSLCIFCAFTQAWHPRASASIQASRLSTSARPREQLIRRIVDEDQSSIRPSFLERNGLRRSKGHRPVNLLKGKNRADRARAAVTGQLSIKLGAGKQRANTKWNELRAIVRDRLASLEAQLADSPLLESLGFDQQSFKTPYNQFRRYVLNSFYLEPRDGQQGSVFDRTLQQVYVERGTEGLDAQLKYAFYGHVAGARFTRSDLHNQKALADLRYPTEWFPATRTMHRTFHLHVGPTNSGKTYHALKRLEEAASGVYAGPLRLLAHEVYTRMNAKGKRCSLITGEERRFPDEDTSPPMSSCTVEMVPLNNDMEVAVIDEIQMIGSPDRGWAWTNAVFGLKAKEIHLCGEERTVPLIRELVASMGDKLEIHRYERLSPLRMMSRSLDGDLRRLRKGDCVVSFSVMGIHALRREIERATGRKVAIVYGSLPPETRAQQAKLFNDPDNDYDFLVASDAIGMGLNLSIKRIIFESAQKHNGTDVVTLKTSDIKQIAGRAGRYRTAAQATDEDTSLGLEYEAERAASNELEADGAFPSPAARPSPQKQNLGLVTTLEKFDFPIVERAMRSEAEPIMTAGLFPPGPIIERFASYFPPGTPFSYILLRLHEISQMHTRYHLCGLRDQLALADVIQPVQNLTTTDRVIFCAAPASTRDKNIQLLVKTLANCVAEQKGGSILDIPHLSLEVLDLEPTGERAYLRELETLHKGLVLYLWLSYRFSGIFNTRALAFHVKELVEDAIEQSLSKFSFSAEARKKIRAARQKSVIDALNRDILFQDETETKAEQDRGEQLKRAGLRPATLGTVGSEEILDDTERGDVTQDVMEMLGDRTSFCADKSSVTDDYDEYPSPELDEEETLEGKTEAATDPERLAADKDGLDLDESLQLDNSTPTIGATAEDAEQLTADKDTLDASSQFNDLSSASQATAEDAAGLEGCRTETSADRPAILPAVAGEEVERKDERMNTDMSTIDTCAKGLERSSAENV